MAAKLAPLRENLAAGLILAPVDVKGGVPKIDICWNHGKSVYTKSGCVLIGVGTMRHVCVPQLPDCWQLLA